MNKEILTPESASEERELILKLYGVVDPKKRTKLQNENADLSDDILSVFYNNFSEVVDITDYTEVRQRGLLKLIYSASRLQHEDAIRSLSSIRWNDKNPESVIPLVRKLFDMQQCEELIVIFYSEPTIVKAVYENGSGKMFGCDADNERLMMYIRKYSPCKIIMIHSHPGTSISMSYDDIRFTESVMVYASRFGSVLTEHFIVSCSNKVNEFTRILAEINKRKDSDRFR